MPDRLAFGAGERMLEPPALVRFRRRVQDPTDHAALRAAAATAEATRSGWDAPDLNRLPAGLAAGAHGEHLPRRRSVIRRRDMPLPDWRFMPDAGARLEPLAVAHLPLPARLSAG
jgi:hypothetical protein